MSQSTEVLGMQLALAADIELDLYLVPKDWVYEILVNSFAQFTISLIKS